tara:strand:+ start:2471 stop:3331 length:861 start_codon:yes stop_codon:yes gene_type:complete
MKKLLPLIIFLLLPLLNFSQAILLMPNDGLWYTYTTDNAVLYDDGYTLNYDNNGLGALTIYPVIGNLVATPAFFDVEYNSVCGWDVFEVYDGDDFTTLIGSYCGTSIPAYFESTHPTGALTFLWSTDGSVTYPGFEIRISNTGFALPIELISFNAGYNGNDVVIDWSVASQVNNDYYKIQRSVDVEDWHTIATVEGGGSVNTQVDYRATDQNPLLGVSYYRLTQTDYDGTTEVFFPVSVVIEPKTKEVIKIFNIFGQEVTLDYQGLIIKLYRDGSVQKINNYGRSN